MDFGIRHILGSTVNQANVWDGISCMPAQSVSHFWLFATLWTVAHQAPLSMGFPRQEYWSELPCPPPGDLPKPGIELTSLGSPALAGRFLTTVPLGKPQDQIEGATKHDETQRTLFPPQRSDGARRGVVLSKPGESCHVSYTGTQSLPRLLQNEGLPRSLSLFLSSWLLPELAVEEPKWKLKMKRPDTTQRYQHREGHKRAAL